MLVAAALLHDVAAGRGALLAAVAAGLAMGGLRAGAAPLPPGFLAVDGALFVLAGTLAVGSALLAGRRHLAPPALIGAVALVVGAVSLLGGARHVVAAASTGALLLASAVVAALGGAGLLFGRVVRVPSAGDDGTPPRPMAGVLGLLAGALVTAAGPHLSLVVAGVILAAWSGWLVQRSGGGSRLPLVPVLTLLLLPAWWLMATIAGPEGLAVGALPMLPTSPAAERLLGLVFLVVAWATAGLWPLHRQVPAAPLAPVGALLLVRVVLPAVPDGLEHWRPLVMPAIVLGIWHAALSGRLAGVAVGLAWVGLLGASREGLSGAALLLAGALALELGQTGRVHRWRPVVRVASALAAGAGALLAVESGLGVEVVYTVLAVGGIVAAVGHTMPQGPALTPPPAALIFRGLVPGK